MITEIDRFELPKGNGTLRIFKEVGCRESDITETEKEQTPITHLEFEHTCEMMRKSGLVKRSKSLQVIICSCQMPPIEIPNDIKTFGDFKRFMKVWCHQAKLQTASESGCRFFIFIFLFPFSIFIFIFITIPNSKQPPWQ